MLCSIAILMINVQMMRCMIGAPGVPIPGSEVISQMFAKRLRLEGSIFNYMKNPYFNETDAGEYVDDNLDVSVLDLNNFRKLIELSKKRSEENFRRQNYFHHDPPHKKNRLQTAGYKKHLRENPHAFSRNPGLWEADRYVEKLFHMMKQSIYVVRDRVDSIKKIRAYFASNPSYKIALLDSAIHHYLRKIDYLYRRVLKNRNKEHFLWFLILYEKVVQSNMDLNYAVERIFKINLLHEQAQAGKPRPTKGLPVNPDAIKDLLGDVDKDLLSKLSGIPGFPQNIEGIN